MDPPKMGANKLTLYLSVFLLTAGIVYEIGFLQGQSRTALEEKELSKPHTVAVIPRDSWIREELADRGWTREQLAAKDLEYKKHIEGKRLTGVE